MNRRFEWDEEKNLQNQRKHGVSFDEGSDVFTDPRALTDFDPEHSANEDRFRTIGLSARLRILMVVTTERSEATRIISARRATAAEQKRYEAQPR